MRYPEYAQLHECFKIWKKRSATRRPKIEDAAIRQTIQRPKQDALNRFGVLQNVRYILSCPAKSAMKFSWNVFFKIKSFKIWVSMRIVVHVWNLGPPVVRHRCTFYGSALPAWTSSSSARCFQCQMLSGRGCASTSGHFIVTVMTPTSEVSATLEFQYHNH